MLGLTDQTFSPVQPTGLLGGGIDDPRTIGLLSLAAGLMQSTPGRKQGIGEALSRGMLSGLGAMQQAQQFNQMQSLRDLQMQQQKRDLDKAKKEDNFWSQIAPTYMKSPAEVALSKGGGPTQANADAMAANPNGQFDFNGMMRAGVGAGVINPMQYAEMMRKQTPKFSTTPQAVMGPDGNPMLVQMAEDGTVKPMTGFSPAEKLHFANTGGATVGLNPFTGQQMAQVKNSLSPDAQASNAVAWANYGLGKSRLAFDQGQANKPQFKDGYWVTPPTAQSPTGGIVATPIAAAPKGSPLDKQRGADSVMGLVDQAEKLLPQATGSYLGAGADFLAQGVGLSTKGAQAGAQLKTLEGALIMAQPRMEGPQSDKDAMLYRQMAGQIGDATVPADTKRAALQAIRELHKKYASPQLGGAPGGIKFLGFE